MRRGRIVPRSWAANGFLSRTDSFRFSRALISGLFFSGFFLLPENACCRDARRIFSPMLRQMEVMRQGLFMLSIKSCHMPCLPDGAEKVTTEWGRLRCSVLVGEHEAIYRRPPILHSIFSGRAETFGCREVSSCDKELAAAGDILLSHDP